MPRLLVLAPPLIFAALAATFYVGMNREDPDALPSALAGSAAPDMALAPLGDTPLLEDAALRAPGVKLVNYWASWCAPCRVEHPNLEALAAEGVPIHGINYKDDPAKALAFLEELGNPYTSLGADENGRTALDWGLYGVPETFVVDGEGRIVLRFAGPLTQRVIAEKIRPAIEAAGG
jgi:cytochrome c biogenesis protein CcmG/thiol:disulfide interchange protein DsbE